MNTFKLLYLTLAMLSVTGCVNTLQANLDKMGLAKFRAYPVREAVLASVFTEYSLGLDATKVNDLTRQQMKFFSKSEEEIVQKALSNDQSNIVTTWTNKEYGDMELRVQKRKKLHGRQCRQFTVTWVEHQYYGIFKHVQRGDACLNPRAKRWEWVV